MISYMSMDVETYMDMIPINARDDLSWALMQTKNYEIFSMASSLGVVISAQDIGVNSIYNFHTIKTEIERLKEVGNGGRKNQADSGDHTSGQGFRRSKENRGSTR